MRQQTAAYVQRHVVTVFADTRYRIHRADFEEEKRVSVCTWKSTADCKARSFETQKYEVGYYG